jgi:hypothetical protein
MKKVILTLALLAFAGLSYAEGDKAAKPADKDGTKKEAVCKDCKDGKTCDKCKDAKDKKEHKHQDKAEQSK